MDSKDILLHQHQIAFKELTEENERLKHRIYLKDRIEQWPLWKILGADHALVIKGSILDRLIKTTAKIDKVEKILGCASGDQESFSQECVQEALKELEATDDK